MIKLCGWLKCLYSMFSDEKAPMIQLGGSINRLGGTGMSQNLSVSGASLDYKLEVDG